MIKVEEEFHKYKLKKFNIVNSKFVVKIVCIIIEEFFNLNKVNTKLIQSFATQFLYSFSLALKKLKFQF